MVKRLLSFILAAVLLVGAFSLTTFGAGGGSELPEVPIEDSSTKVFKRAKNPDKTLRITGYTGKDSEIVIPSSIVGVAVTAIGDGAFREKTVTGVTIPDSVISIGAGAFEDCAQLTRVTLADSVVAIGEGAFKNCAALTEFTVPAGVSEIARDAFSGCSSLNKVTLPAGTVSIASGAFDGADALSAVYFAGAREEWYSVSIDPEGNAALLSAPVCCSDDDGHLFRTETAEPTCTAGGYRRLICAECDEVRVIPTAAALGHTVDAWIETAAPTCTAEGIETGTCSRCGGTVTRHTAALGHDYKDTVTAPTCTEQGFTTHACSRCSDSYVDSYTAALGHDFGEWIASSEPNCTEKGAESRACARCGKTEEREIPATGHDYEAAVTAPTCTEQGFTAHTCTKCGDSYVDGFVPAAGHRWGEWTEVTPATEEEEGLERRVCLSDPSHFEERAIPVKEHVHVMETVPGIDATCTADGVTAHYRCTGCGRYFADNGGEREINSEDAVIPATGHVFGEWSTASAATCTDGGTEERVCPKCGETETRPTSALGHDYQAAVTAPTCTEQGFTTHSCSRCTVCYVDAYTAALGHDFGEWVEITASTCTEKGSEERVCSRCGEKETRETAATGHDYEDTVTAPTCADRGFTTHVCSRCGDSYDDTFVEAAGHDFGADGNSRNCAVCGAANPDYKPPVKFKDVPDGAYFKDAVDWAVAKGITVGTGKDTFSPDDGCTRAQVVTFLWRAAGEPEPDGAKNPFRDVKKSDYFYKAVLWAVKDGITVGTSETAFSPNDECTRGQIVAFLWRSHGEPEPKTKTNPFRDVGKNDYFYRAVLWAVEKEITVGTDKTHFSPSETCTRGQIVTFLYRAR